MTIHLYFDSTPGMAKQRYSKTAVRFPGAISGNPFVYGHFGVFSIAGIRERARIHAPPHTHKGHHGSRRAPWRANAGPVGNY